MRSWANQLGLEIPAIPDLAEAGIALAIVVLVGLAGWVIGRRLGPRLADFWERKAGHHAEGLVPRMAGLVRDFIAWPLLALALSVHAWPVLANLILGIALAVAAASLVRSVARGLQLPRWGAWLLAGFVFVALLADAVGGLARITEALDRVAFTVGSRRLSLLLIIQILVALLALYAAVRLANRLVAQAITRSRGLDPTQQLLAQKLAGVAIIAAAIFVAIDLSGIDLTALAVFSGAVGLAIGFGLQKTVGNLIAGIILLMDRSIKPGDVISVGESFGSVSKIGVRAVSIVTRDGKEYLIPNEILMTEEVVNWSYSTRDVRISIPVRIAYGSDVELARRLMREAAVEAPRVLENPAPVVWVTKLGEDAIHFEIRIWIQDPEAGLGSVQSEVLTRLLAIFEKEGIDLPFPQYDVRVKEWPSSPVPHMSPAADGHKG